MTSSTGSISVSGLLGGTAGQIDVTSLISSLMKAQSVPKNLLSDQRDTVAAKLSAYQAVNTKLTSVQSAADNLTKDTTWRATTASSSSTAVVATSTSDAAPGSTTFDVVRLAAAQVSTVAADADGNVIADPSAGVTVTGADGVPHSISVNSGSAADVAAAVNGAGVGVRASVVKTDQGVQLQFVSTRTGAANAFTVSGTDTAARNVVTASDAQLAVGGSSGYTVSGSTNTFTGVIPGVTFSVNAPATNVTVSVASDAKSIGASVKALVAATNTARSELSADSGQGAILQGASDVRGIINGLAASISRGTSTGASLKTYGIDVDKTGVMTFDADVFAAAYAADPDGTQQAVGSSFAAGLKTAASAAVDDTTGSITQSIDGLTDTGERLTTEIDDWTSRLADIQSALQVKYAAMQSALSRLQTQQTYVTSMLDSITNSKESSS